MQAQETITSHTLNCIQQNVIKLLTQFIVTPKYAEYHIFYFIQYTVFVTLFFFMRICMQKRKTWPTMALHSTFYTKECLVSNRGIILHHHHVQEGLGLIPVPCILKMKLVPPSLPRSSYVSSSFWFFTFFILHLSKIMSQWKEQTLTVP